MMEISCSHKFISMNEFPQAHGVVAYVGRTQGARICNFLCVLVGYKRGLLKTKTKRYEKEISVNNQ